MRSFEQENRRQDTLICLGDPFSINIEAISALMQDSIFLQQAANRRMILIGSLFHFHEQRKRLGYAWMNLQLLRDLSQIQLLPAGVYFYPIPFFCDIPTEDLNSEQRGKIAVTSLESIKSVSLASYKVLTCPINKAACQQAGFSFPGQTEFFSDLWQGQGVMTLVGDAFFVGLLTNHLALKDVPFAVSKESIITKAKILLDHFAHQKRHSIRLAICGLNPHIGDSGLFGSEDEEIVLPACKYLQSLGYKVFGPISADTVFYDALRGCYDGVLALYHDQGLGPFKTLYFDTGINITLGLKHLRVSPDHGPAKDLFLKKQASYKSFEKCLEMQA